MEGCFERLDMWHWRIREDHRQTYRLMLGIPCHIYHDALQQFSGS